MNLILIQYIYRERDQNQFHMKRLNTEPLILVKQDNYLHACNRVYAPVNSHISNSMKPKSASKTIYETKPTEPHTQQSRQQDVPVNQNKEGKEHLSQEHLI